MALVIFNQGKALIVEAIINKTAPQNLILRLFQNNYTPLAGDTEAQLTEASFTGYAAITLTGSSWGAASVANPAVASFAQQTFTSSADQATQNLYGYYVTQAASGKAVWAERFSDAPWPISFNGDLAKVTPRFQES
jgi:hypothetical protein